MDVVTIDRVSPLETVKKVPWWIWIIIIIIIIIIIVIIVYFVNRSKRQTIVGNLPDRVVVNGNIPFSQIFQ